MTHPITTQTETAKPPYSAAVLVTGFAMALAVWCVWFATHLPWTGLSEQTATIAVLAAWFLAAVAAGKVSPGINPLKLGPLAGLLSAALGLLLVGTRLNTKATGLDAIAQPALLATVGAFLALGAIIGTVGIVLGSRLRSSHHPVPRQAWLARMGLVTAVAIAPLLFIGGLVTSTNAGMAVPDWPNTYGTNMFLYPLRPDIAKNFTEGMNYTDVFLEHSHRLFGSFIGLTTIGMLVLTLLVLRPSREGWLALVAAVAGFIALVAIKQPIWVGLIPLLAVTVVMLNRRWVVGLAFAVLFLVCVQGVLGGKRVLFGNHIVELDNRWWSMLHGVLGQLVFAVAIALAVVLMPSWRHALDDRAGSLTIAKSKLLRICTTGAMHATVLQLVFGAMYRHHRHVHALYAHIGFSVVVLIMAMLAGIAATTATGSMPLARRLRVFGGATLAVVILQFTLGWVAFLAGGSGNEAKTTFEALIRTIHQANGALFLALIVALWLSARRALSSLAEPVGVPVAA